MAAAACGAFALRPWRKKKRMKRLPSFTHLFPSFQNPISFSLVNREEDPNLSFHFFFFFPPRTRARHVVGRPRNRGPESRALNNRGPDESRALKNRSPDESRTLNNRGPESRGPVNVNMQRPPKVIRAVL